MEKVPNMYNRGDWLVYLLQYHDTNIIHQFPVRLFPTAFYANEITTKFKWINSSDWRLYYRMNEHRIQVRTVCAEIKYKIKNCHLCFSNTASKSHSI